MEPSPSHTQFPSTASTIVPSPAPAPASVLVPKQPGPVGPDLKPVTPSTIPPSSPRTLVLCFDGTGDEFDSDNSNIIHLVHLLKKGDQTKQMVYYHPGLGTATPPLVPTFLTTTVQGWIKTLDLQFAFSLREHVLDGYRFLMEYYTAGDRICLFGFSRGAYTARALAGMLYKVGLLQAGNTQQVPFAYQMFCDLDAWDACNHFKLTFSTDVGIEFIGVWDTVNSVGLVAGKRLPFTSSNYAVRTFRQALSLDERRVKFKANTWNRPEPDELDLGTGPPKGNEDEDIAVWKLERKWAKKNPNAETNILEVWFAGCHCDVGGGSVPNLTRNSLARIPLRWMIRECFKTKSGIMFESEKLRYIGLDPRTLYDANGEVVPRPKPLSVLGPNPPTTINKIKRMPPPPPQPNIIVRAWRKVKQIFGFASPFEDAPHVEDEPPPTTTEEEEELQDALSPMYDQIELQPWWKWRLLEYLPLMTRYQNEKNEWVTKHRWNRGRPRIIPFQKDGLNVHRSVQIRMEAEFEDRPGKKYVPSAKFDVKPNWIA